MKFFRNSILSVLSISLLLGLSACGAKHPSSSTQSPKTQTNQKTGSNTTQNNNGASTNSYSNTKTQKKDTANNNQTTAQSGSSSLTNLTASDYFSATKTVDNFLNDWLNYDPNKGMDLLSQTAKSGQKKSVLENYFSQNSPAHAGYEVVGFSKKNANQFTFHVWLYKSAMGVNGTGGWSKPQPYKLTLVRLKNSWYIDNLPKQEVKEKNNQSPSNSLTNLTASNYFSAVNTADMFLNDWLSQDENKAVALLSQSKNGKSQSDFNKYFAQVPPSHQGYEIIGYNKLSQNKFEFHVWMYANAMGVYGTGGWSKPQPSSLIVVKENGQWRIYNLPKF